MHRHHPPCHFLNYHQQEIPKRHDGGQHTFYTTNDMILNLRYPLLPTQIQVQTTIHLLPAILLPLATATTATATTTQVPPPIRRRQVTPVHPTLKVAIRMLIIRIIHDMSSMKVKCWTDGVRDVVSVCIAMGCYMKENGNGIRNMGKDGC